MRAVISRDCAVCGKPVGNKSVKVEVGPLFVEMHPRCADPAQRVQYALDWLDKLFK